MEHNTFDTETKQEPQKFPSFFELMHQSFHLIMLRLHTVLSASLVSLLCVCISFALVLFTLFNIETLQTVTLVILLCITSLSVIFSIYIASRLTISQIYTLYMPQHTAPSRLSDAYENRKVQLQKDYAALKQLLSEDGNASAKAATSITNFLK